MKFGKKTLIMGTALVVVAGGALAAFAQPGGRHGENFGPMGHICEANRRAETGIRGSKGSAHLGGSQREGKLSGRSDDG